MAGKVFISCGQNNSQERQVANQLNNWFLSQGFHPYVAIQTQSILELNSGIIAELKSADFYLFINFRREKFHFKRIFPSKQDFYRGSVFTNQELAIAYSLAFDRMIFLNQSGVRRDGFFGHIVANTPEFDDYGQVLPIVQTAVISAVWDPSYSRNLSYQNLRWSIPFQYTDHTGSRTVKALHIDILNNRPDKGAANCVARLNEITHNSVTSVSPDHSHLKCKGFPGYANTIWPSNYASFDLLSIDLTQQSNIYLHSAADIHPRQPIISAIGKYLLHYQVFAQEFPIIEFIVDLQVTGNEVTTIAKLR